MPGDVGLVAQLLNTLFTWATGPDGWEKLSLERKIGMIHAAIQISQDKGDDTTTDLLFDQYRELSKRTGS